MGGAEAILFHHVQAGFAEETLVREELVNEKPSEYEERIGAADTRLFVNKYVVERVNLSIILKELVQGSGRPPTIS